MVTILNQEKEPLFGIEEQDKILNDFYNIIHKISKKFISKDGVDFNSLKASDKFQKYLEVASNLQNLDLANLTEQERKCFCINLYNFMAIHILIELELPEIVQGTEIQGIMYIKNNISSLCTIKCIIFVFICIGWEFLIHLVDSESVLF